MNNEENNNDNLYFLFKDTSNSKSGKEMFFEPKVNKPEWGEEIWDALYEAFSYDAEKMAKKAHIKEIQDDINNLKNKFDKKSTLNISVNLDYDSSRLERRLISLLDSIESLLEYLEDRRQNRSEGNF